MTTTIHLNDRGSLAGEPPFGVGCTDLSDRHGSTLLSLDIFGNDARVTLMFHDREALRDFGIALLAAAAAPDPAFTPEKATTTSTECLEEPVEASASA